MTGLKGLMGAMMLKCSLAWGKVGGESPCKSDISVVSMDPNQTEGRNEAKATNDGGHRVTETRHSTHPF